MGWGVETSEESIDEINNVDETGFTTRYSSYLSETVMSSCALTVSSNRGETKVKKKRYKEWVKC
ncbi:hypothetical protein PQD71_gp258 [Kosakonia phage Kc263]|uniref:Uncharacterized protein n=1 Tax=Kosakonia phage Kc263 TaxID=2863194 RepID=A0AAE7WFS0_9CAUD|nr:hypothetical protein PQD71_gp258 [Kosakonia phage Kc263]QYN80068.1 hypothetical protein [Kosakonia phage Kc263]